MAKKFFVDRGFQKLAQGIRLVLDANEGLIGDQQKQVESLVKCERRFRNEICKYAKSEEVYLKFIDYVNNDLGNILSAQTYFREMSSSLKGLSVAIRTKNVKSLMSLNINYQFANFIVNNYDQALPGKSKQYFDELVETRRILIENNLPQVVNQAKIFYNKTPKSHHTLLDFIGICTYGLISGVDKYTGDYSTVWRSVGIGRMVGFLIEEYSKTFIRLYPSDRKILYRSNALRGRMGIDDIKVLAEVVNESFQKDIEAGRSSPKLPISMEHIESLLNSSGYTNANANLDKEDAKYGGIYDATECPDMNIEENLEKHDTMNHVYNAAQSLNLIEKKIIKLKGVDV